MKQAPKIKIPFLTYYRMAKHDLIGLRTKIFSEYGDIARGKVKGFVNYNIAHPDYAKHILQDNQDNYFPRHPLFREVFLPFLGVNSLVMVNNMSQWYRNRITANVSFEPRVYFNDYAHTIVQLCGEMLERWNISYKEGQYINIANEIDELVLTIMTRTLFTSIDIDEKTIKNVIIEIIDLIKRKLSTPFFIWYFSSSRQAYQNKINYVKQLFAGIVEKRLNDSEVWDDTIGCFLQEYKNFPREKMIEFISDQIATLFAMGYFTITSLLHWALVKLSYYPDVEKQITQEVNKVIGEKPPTYNDIISLQYLPLVLKEVLRLHPSSFSIMREAIADDTLGGFHISKNAGITLSVYHIHRHPDFWINPEGFNPERFQNNPLGQEHPFAYLPFGAGKRKCPGAAYSTLEVAIIIAMVVKRFRLHLPSNAEVKPHITTLISMRPNLNRMRLHFK